LESFEGGVRCDAFSIHQAGDTQEDPVLMIPDPASAFIDPFTKTPTQALICNIRDSATGLNISCDPRFIAQKAEAYLQKTQMGDTANFGLRFVRLINGAQDDQSIKQGRSEVQMAEAKSCVAERAGSGQSDIQQQSGDYFVLTPMDSWRYVGVYAEAAVRQPRLKHARLSGKESNPSSSAPAMRDRAR
jgi:glutamine synthetase